MRAQTYNLTAIDGGRKAIILNEDYVKNELVISCGTDSILIEDFTGIDTIAILNNQFLSIAYRVRGGMGVHFRHTLWVTCLGGEMVESLHVLSNYRSSFNKTYTPADTLDLWGEEELFTASLKFKGNSPGNYEIETTVRNYSYSKYYFADKNFDRTTEGKLYFDKANGIFYSRMGKPESPTHIAKSPSDILLMRSMRDKDVPIIELDTHKYYWIEGRWR